MTSVYVDLENCYGISKFKNTFIFDDENKAHMIYAPNGIMKTSFANTFSDICKNKEDCFYPTRQTKRLIKYNSDSGEDIKAASIIVIEPYSDTFKSQNSYILLANTDLKSEYEKIHSDIDEKFKTLSNILSAESGKRDVSRVLSEDFSYAEKDYYDCLESIYDHSFNSDFVDFSKIKYGRIINADADKLFNDPDVVSLLNSYIKLYKKLLTESKVFKISFNHSSAEDSLSSLTKSGFFKARHRVILDGEKEALNESEFKALLSEEKKRIIDTELADEFKKIDEFLSAKSATKTIRDFIFGGL